MSADTHPLLGTVPPVPAAPTDAGRILRGAEAAKARRIDLVGPVDTSTDLAPTGPWAADARRAFDQAQRDGYAAGVSQGREEGLALARSEMADELARLNRALATLAAQVDTRVAAAVDELVNGATDLALVIAEAVVGREVRTAADPGADAIARCLALAPLPGAVVAHLSPADAERLGPLPTLDGRPFTVVADPALQPGDARVTVGETLVDGRLDQALARVAELLTGVPAGARP